MRRQSASGTPARQSIAQTIGTKRIVRKREYENYCGKSAAQELKKRQHNLTNRSNPARLPGDNEALFAKNRRLAKYQTKPCQPPELPQCEQSDSGCSLASGEKSTLFSQKGTVPLYLKQNLFFGNSPIHPWVRLGTLSKVSLSCHITIGFAM